MMDWERFEQLIEAELDGELTARERDDLDAVCEAEPDLAEIRRQDTAAARMLRRVGPSLAPEGLATAVLERLDAEGAFGHDAHDAYEDSNAGQRAWSGAGDSNSWPRQEPRSIWLAIFGSQALRASFALGVMILIVYQASIVLRKPIDKGLGAILGSSEPQPPPASRQTVIASKNERFQEPAGPATDESAYFVGDPPAVEVALAVSAAPTPAGEEAAFEGDGVELADAAPLEDDGARNLDGTIAGTPDIADTEAPLRERRRAEAAAALAAAAEAPPLEGEAVALAAAAPAELPLAAPAVETGGTPMERVMNRVRDDLAKIPEVEIASAPAVAPPTADASIVAAQPGVAPVSKTRIVPPVAAPLPGDSPAGVELASIDGVAVAEAPAPLAPQPSEAVRRADAILAKDAQSPRVVIQLAQAAPSAGLPTEAQPADALAGTARGFAPTRSLSGGAPRMGRRNVETSLARARIDFLRTVDASDAGTARYRCRATKAQLDTFFRDLERQGIGAKRAAAASFYSYSDGKAKKLPASAPQEVEIIIVGGAE